MLDYSTAEGLTIEHMREAHERIKPYINRTPVLQSQYLNELTGADLFFKCENFQEAGAFKVRGACNAVFGLTEDASQKRRLHPLVWQPRAVSVVMRLAVGASLQRGHAAHCAAGQKRRGDTLWWHDHRMRALHHIARSHLRRCAGPHRRRFRPSLQ